jgi:sugar-specific transcriptional regulator TrmB
MILDFELLAKVGLNQYERQTLLALLRRGVADASTLCEDGEIPSSKIYQATERLEKLGLISIQRSRPRLFAAMSPEPVIDRLAELAREEAESFAEATKALLDVVRGSESASRSTNAFADMAMGRAQHVSRHLVHLSAAKLSIVSYLEHPDIQAISAALSQDLNILRRIRKNAEGAGINHRIVFGFDHREAPALLEFLKTFRNELRSATGIRYAGVLGHPFHVIDGETVILSLDNPFLPDRRVASLMIRNQELAQTLTRGFDSLWEKAMKSLQEVNFDPRVSPRRT